MWELHEIGRNCKFDPSEFSKKILPVPIQYLKLDDFKVLNLYLQYWVEKRG